MTQTTTSQLGSATAHPAALVPQLHHLKAMSGQTYNSGEKPDQLIFQDIPSFPDDVPTAPLLRLSLRKLLEGDTDEENNLWRACCDLGFVSKPTVTIHIDIRDRS